MFKLFKKQNETVEITISNNTILRVIGLVVGAFLLFNALRSAKYALMLIFVAVFLSLALNAPVHWLAMHMPGKRKGSRTLGTTVSFLLVIGFLIGFLASVVPSMVRQTTDFIEAAPSIVAEARSEDTSLGRLVRKYNLESQVDEFTSELRNFSRSASGQAFGTLARIGGSIVSTLTVLVLTFMMLIEGPRLLSFGLRVVPEEHQPDVKRISGKMYRVIKGYVNGQVFLAALAAVIIVVPLFIFKVSSPIALMVVVFICGLIPLVGNTIGAVIVSAVALFTSPLTALIILAYYILYQQIENYVIQPRVQANSTDMSPLLVFMSVLVGVSFGGLLGGLVAIPIAGCLRILLLEYLERRNLISRAEVAAKTTQKQPAAPKKASEATA